MIRQQEQPVQLGKPVTPNRTLNTLTTPLSSLRLSALATSPSHQSRLIKSLPHSRSQSISRHNSVSTKSSATRKPSISPKEPARKADTFKSEFSLDDYIKEVNGSKDLEVVIADKVDNEDQLKLAKLLIALFLDSRRSLRTDLNIVNPTEAAGPNDNLNSNGDAPNLKVSRSTLLRAKKVQTNIALKYIYIQRVYEWSQLNGETNYHPGVEGIYNPLQILRNRKIREKYHEYPKQLTAKTLPLACNVFSSKNINPKKPWKMLWAIELNELISDFSWRTAHWHHLKKPNGEYWFPNDRTTLGYKEKKRKRLIRRKLHDKLFNDSDSESDGASASKIKIKPISKHGVASVKSSESEGHHLFRVSKSKSPSKKRLRHRVKDRAKRMYGHNNDSSSSSWYSDEESVVVDDELNENERAIKEKMFEAVHSSQEAVHSNNNSRELVDEDSPSTSATKLDNSNNSSRLDVPSIPMIKVEDEPSNLNLFNVPIKPLEGKNPATDPAEPAEDQVEEKPSSLTPVETEVSQVDTNELIMREVNSQLQFIDNVLYLRINYLINVYPQLMNTLDSRLNYILYEQVPEIGRSTVNINDDMLPAFEVLYHGFLNEVKSLVHMVNDVYAVRIDNLLSNSDRSIGEINTSLSLELRKVNEKLDKLNSSLFSNVVTEKFKVNDEGGYRILYYMLENTIVVLLRLIWVVVNIYKFLYAILMVFWKIIKFLFTLLRF